MKKLSFLLLTLLPCCLLAQHATIKFDAERVLGDIDPKIYGVFMEPIQISGRRGLPDSPRINTLYGTLYDPSSPLADENGFRKDFIEAMKDLKVTNMRWPGGNFLMGYNWQDGIGPKEKRPARINMAWGGIDSNQVGTDEWFALNKSMGTENVVAVNLGLGNIQDAAYWLEYCNYPSGTYYAGLRAKNGHPQPYKVKIWDLGNEVDGKPWELGHKNAEDYIEIAREAAKAMLAVDNTIELVGCGSSWYSQNEWDNWNRKILTGIGDKIKYLSIHSYWENSTDYYTHMGVGAKIFDDRIKITAGEIDAVSNTQGFKNPIYLSVDEWGAFGRNFMSVLPVAQSFNSFIRHANVVKMANFTLLTSVLASDPKRGTYKSPLYHVFKAYANNCLGKSIDSYVVCDTFNTEKYKGLAYLDVSAVYSKQDNAVYLNIVNRHKDAAITADIISVAGSLNGKAEASVITAKEMMEAFTFDKQKEYLPVNESISGKNNMFTYRFPAHSFTQIKIPWKQ
ncbi:MAG TPA: alpha-L-arabinofuranosidase C-terminal domain-containing protein [Chitinophagaceae bacterium]|nr:alpha-L-arabinofuranosidase C-terminal domain-containing protein [Chitinophagaceae bacterium]